MGGVYGRQANRFDTDAIKKVSVKIKYGHQEVSFEPVAVDYSTTGIHLEDDFSPDIKKGLMLVINIWIGDDMKQIDVEGQVVWIKVEDSKMSYGVEFFEESAKLPKPGEQQT